MDDPTRKRIAVQISNDMHDFIGQSHDRQYFIRYSNITSFFHFVDKRAIY